MQVPLTRGRVAIIDDEDWPLVQDYKWRLQPNGSWSSVYAVAGKYPYAVWMHNLILPPSRGLRVDHIDRDGLNNRRSNLRLATDAQNNANRATKRGGYRGVYPHRTGHTWQALIGGNVDRQYLGMFATPEDAARAYDAAAKVRYGEFAHLNFPG